MRPPNRFRIFVGGYGGVNMGSEFSVDSLSDDPLHVILNSTDIPSRQISTLAVKLFT